MGTKNACKAKGDLQMIRFTTQKYYVLIILVIVASFMQVQGQGQGEALEEVIVTAHKRAVAVHDIPTTVSVVGGMELEKFQVTSFEELDQLVPGLIFNRTPGDNIAITIRGVGTFSGQQAFEQSVISLVDGIYGGFQKDYSIALFDLERVEVLKGTQAGILGKNSSVGAIHVVTKKPGNELGGYISSEYEFEYPGWFVEGAVDLPVNNDFRIRLSGRARETDGYAQNVISGRDVPQRDEYAARINAVWDVSETIQISLMGQYDNRVVGSVQSLVGDNPGGIVSARDPRFVTGQGIRELVVFTSGIPVGGIDEPIDEVESLRGALTIDADIGNHTVTSITTGSWVDNRFTLDFDFFTAGLYFDQIGEFTQVSQELRLASQTDQRFRYLAGLYYLHSEWDRTYFDVVNPGPKFYTRIPFNQKTDNFSIFGEGDYDLTDKLSASATVRWTTEDRDVVIESFSPVAGFVTWPVVFRGFPRTEQSRSPDFVDWGVSLTYAPVDDVMLYATFNKGTKTGAFADITGNVVNNANEVKDEIARNWEIGAKLNFTEVAAYLNISAFRMTIKDFQQAIVVAGNFVTENIDVESQGIELEAAWSPLENLTLTGSATYIDSEDLTAHIRPLRSPDWNGNVRMEYQHPISGTGYTWDLSASALYRASYFNTPGVIFNKSDTRSTLDLALGLEHESGWRVSLLGKNITDERDCGHGSFSNQFPVADGLALCMLEMPRTIALQGRYSF
jgi:iron complex outermembrane receptor protein